MPFQLIPLPKPVLHPSSFLRKFRYADERDLVAQVLRRANHDQCRIHALIDEELRYYGFSAMSLSQFNSRPAIVLEYLFASQDQRGVRYTDLGDLTAGEFLLQFCLRQARSLNEIVPIDYLTLEPASDRLVQYYLDKEFKLVDRTGWMFISI